MVIVTNAIKMNIVPRLCFLFQSLPVEIPLKEFNKKKRMISVFIWHRQTPRGRFQTLHLPKEKV